MVRNGNNFLQICKQLGALTSQDWTPGDLFDFLSQWVIIPQKVSGNFLSSIFNKNINIVTWLKNKNDIVTYCERKDNSIQKIVYAKT